MESTDEAGHDFILEQVVKHGQEVSTGKLLENNPKHGQEISITNAGSSVHSTSLQSDHVASKNNSAVIAKPGKKKMKCEIPPKSVTTIDEMNSLLVRHRRSSRAMRPRRSSVRDQEILAARSQIENASAVVNDQELYAPFFRNVSMFKSYVYFKHSCGC
ncbi:hypothetical protein CRYUN_Cryun34aG0022900 [Craigia yunnanensis]